MNHDSKLHNIAGIAATIIVGVMVIWGAVYVFNYFKGAKTDIMVNDLKIEVEKQGTGDGAKRGDTVSVNYIGTLTDGKEFDNSYKRGEPISVTLGEGQVIRGWEEGLLGMRVGEKRKLTIPPSLGYGDRAVGGIIPANATLVFETELVSITHP
ncbi:MAG: FKBP-type peptidyl-prolyl cis-trans isomerase [Patescibacteria group bacterium]